MAESGIIAQAGKVKQCS